MNSGRTTTVMTVQTGSTSRSIGMMGERSPVAGNERQVQSAQAGCLRTVTERRLDRVDPFTLGVARPADPVARNPASHSDWVAFHAKILGEEDLQDDCSRSDDRRRHLAWRRRPAHRRTPRGLISS